MKKTITTSSNLTISISTGIDMRGNCECDQKNPPGRLPDTMGKYMTICEKCDKIKYIEPVYITAGR